MQTGVSALLEKKLGKRLRNPEQGATAASGPVTSEASQGIGAFSCTTFAAAGETHLRGCRSVFCAKEVPATNHSHPPICFLDMQDTLLLYPAGMKHEPPGGEASDSDEEGGRGTAFQSQKSVMKIDHVTSPTKGKNKKLKR